MQELLQKNMGILLSTWSGKRKELKVKWWKTHEQQIQFGKSYLGINGLFSNILTMLSLTKFGIGSAILFKLYDLIEKLEELHINAVFTFLLYLLRSVSTYFFFAYKNAIVKANQKEYLLNFVNYVFTIGFEIYVAILVLRVILENIVCAGIANRMYPYIN